MADSFVTAFAIAAVTAFIAAITPVWLAVAGVVLLGAGVAVMANIPEESVPDWLKPVKEGADGIADKAVKMLKEGPVSVVEDIGQGLMDEIQTPEGIASVAGGTVGTLAGGYAGSRVNSALKIKKVEYKSVEDTIKNLKETTNGKGIARNFESSGGYKKTIKDFEMLNPKNVKEIQTQYGIGRVGTLSDGTKIVARPGSKTGGATLEIRISNRKVYKIRY